MYFRRTIRPLAYALLFCFAAGLPSLFGSSDDAKWAADIDYLARELPRLHKNAFFQVSREQFEAEADALKANLASLADHQVIVGMMKLVARIGDAHTALSGQLFNRYPVGVYAFEDGWFVVRATEEHRDLLGLKLVSIDGHPIEEVVAEVATVISHENGAWLLERAPNFLVMAEVLHALGLTTRLDSARFSFTAAGGGSIDRDLSPAPAGASWLEHPDRALVPLPMYLRQPGLNYWFEYLERERVLYVKYNLCRDIPGLPFTQFGFQLQTVLATYPVDRLVLDMRSNPGGNSNVLQPLITGVQMLPEFNRPDRFFVIVGRRTFSSAVLNSIQLRQQTNATFLGEPTGGKPNSYGEVQTFLLPRSGHTVSYSIKYFEMLPGEDPPSFLPDRVVLLSSSDYFSGYDPVFASVLPRFGRIRPV